MAVPAQGPDAQVIAELGGADPQYFAQQRTNWQQVYADLNRLGVPTDHPAVQSVLRYDVAGVLNGNAPLAVNDTKAAIIREMGGTPLPQPAPSGYQAPTNPGSVLHDVWHFLGSVAGDVGQVVKALPGLPGTLVHDVSQVVSHPDQVFGPIEAAAAHGSLGDVVRAATQAPGVRLIPGMYAAGNILTGNVGQLAEHPLLNALDILPLVHAVAPELAGTVAAKAGDAAEALRARGIPVPRIADKVTQEATGSQPIQGQVTVPVQTQVPYVGATGGDVINIPTRIPTFTGMAPIIKPTVTLPNALFGLADTTAPGVADVVTPGLISKIATLADRLHLGPQSRDVNQFYSIAQRTLNRASAPLGSLAEETWAATDPARWPDVFHAAETGDYSSLTPDELAALQRSRTLMNEHAEQMTADGYYVARDLPDPQNPGGTYRAFFPADNSDVQLALKREAQADRFDSNVIPKLADRVAGLRERTDYWQGQADQWRQRAGEAGVDNDLNRPLAQVRTQIESARTSGYPLSARQLAAFDELLSTDADHPGALLRAEQALGRLDLPAAKDALGDVSRFVNHPSRADVLPEVLRGRTGDVAGLVDEVSNPSNPVIRDAARGATFADRTAASLGDQLEAARTTLGDRQAMSARYRTQTQDMWSSKITETRFKPLIEEEIRNQASRALEARRAAGEQIPAVDDLIASGTYHTFFSAAQLREFADDATQTVNWLRDQGVDPTFFHHIDPAQIRSAALNPTVSASRPFTPSQIRDRSLLQEARVQNPVLALQSYLVEPLRQRITEQLLGEYRDAFGVKEGDLNAQLRADVARGPTPRSDLGVAGELARVKNRDWIEFDPDERMPWRRARSTPSTAPGATEPGERTFIPKTVYSEIEKLVPSGKSVPLKWVYDKTMGAFRLAVLGLSPRWAIYNIFGGLAMLLMDSSPKALQFDRLRSAWEMAGGWQPFARGGRTLAEANVASALPVEVSQGTATAAKIEDVVGRMSDQNGPVAKAFQMLQKPAAWNFNLNQFVDDMYRSLAYLEGSDGRLTAELRAATNTPEEAQLLAHDTGIRAANRLLQDWDRMTSAERFILRNVFPFYGWMSHILRFAYHYPADHPIRTAIITNFAANELADKKEGLAERFRNYIPISGRDNQGNMRYLDLGGANPFSTLADMFNLPGLLSSTNPFAKAGLEALGVDTQTATPQQTTTHYDEKTGRLVADRPADLGVRILRSFIPQLNAIPLTDADRRLAQTNPEAYSRQRISALGLPPISQGVPFTRTENLTQLEIRDTLNRKKATDARWAAAIKPLKAGQDPRGTAAWVAAAHDPVLGPLIAGLERTLTPAGG